MSAFLVPKTHIDALVTVAMDGPTDTCRWYGSRNVDPSAVGQMLATENARSVGYRYDDASDMIAPWVYAYEYRASDRRPTIVQALQALRCYEYQACEHPEWMTSAAFAWCTDLRAQLCRHLPGMDTADGWTWDHA